MLLFFNKSLSSKAAVISIKGFLKYLNKPFALIVLVFNTTASGPNSIFSFNIASWAVCPIYFLIFIIFLPPLQIELLLKIQSHYKILQLHL